MVGGPPLRPPGWHTTTAADTSAPLSMHKYSACEPCFQEDISDLMTTL